MAYKPDTPVIEESQGVMIAASLAKSGWEVTVYDPLALENTRAVLRDSVAYAASAGAALAEADVAVITTACAEFKALPAAAFVDRRKRRLKVIDCWRVLPPEVHAVADVVHLGRGRERDEGRAAAIA
jgi:UDPglucose 6-dehydrogenase